MHIHSHPLHADAGMFVPLVYGLSSLWWLLDVLQRHGPSYEAIGPILLGVAAMVNARANMIRARNG